MAYTSRYSSIGVKKGKYYILNYYRKDDENSRSRFATVYQKKKEERAALAKLSYSLAR